MEKQYVKCTNPNCQVTYEFYDFKTGVGKTKQQLKEERCGDLSFFMSNW